ncbi:MAG TPA: hypothetical protein VJB63_03145 [Patescibacteria group bacterium]|nr:hypothetical protein [Patescibacteria group bacterium]
MSKLYTKIPPYAIISILTVVSTCVLWIPFLFHFQSINGIQVETPNFQTVLKHYDGPLYIIPAKTLYNINDPLFESHPMGLTTKYFAAHLPLYPLFIKALAPILGYLKSMLTITVFFSIAFFNFFYYFLRKLKITEQPLILTLVLLFFTPRLLVVRSVGSSEPLFLFLILASVFFFIQKKYFFAGILGGLAAMTKTPGILLFIGYVFWFVEHYIKTRKVEISWIWILLIPIGLLLVFLLYWQQYGDFFAYFHSGDNIHLIFPPFSVFNFQKNWVGTAWLEEIVFLYFFYLISLFTLYHNKLLRPAFYFALIFFLAAISIQHRDISRYTLPLLPFAAIVYEKFFTSKKFLITLIILIPAIYLYAWNFMLYNIAPITDWSPFL